MGDNTSSGAAPSAPKQNSSAPADSRGAEQKKLLTPVVRSKRTPIACTECRRRQVKCTGTTPQCERCSKRSIKCEYIPCSQQKAASSSPPLRPTYPEHLVTPSPPYQSRPLLHRATASWQPDYYADGHNSYHPPRDWTGQDVGVSMSESQAQGQSFNGVPVHPRTARSHYSGDDYGPAAYGYQPFGETSTAQQGFSSHNAYQGGLFPSTYPSPDADMGSGDLGLSYAYSADPGRATGQARISSQHSPYSQYSHGGNDMYNPLTNGVLPDGTSQGWSSSSLGLRPSMVPLTPSNQDAPYVAYPGHLSYV